MLMGILQSKNIRKKKQINKQQQSKVVKIIKCKIYFPFSTLYKLLFKWNELKVNKKIINFPQNFNPTANKTPSNLCL